MNLLRITRIGIKFVQLLFIPFVSSFTQINNRYKVTNLKLNDFKFIEIFNKLFLINYYGMMNTTIDCPSIIDIISVIELSF